MPTRWSGTKAILNRVIVNKVGICRGELATFLSLVREAAEVMEGELYLTLRVRYLCFVEEKLKCLVDKVSDSAAIKIIRRSLREKLNFRFPIDDYTALHYLAVKNFG
ncbi:hypothetical protein QYM36_013195 [Artemia franciscana]|uniref:Uncharacterized protein n=1 Tax=Artemia franciscana TaxID=6661 RepID=A0AA88KW43_ARTSF|nr:hypothetical protein QYM36_013195 [Artemia franciscana]